MIVDIEKLSVDYSGIKALDGISFGIDEGDFLGIIGPNGAGKSTLFRCMLGLDTQYDGIIKFFDRDITRLQKIPLTGGICSPKTSRRQEFSGNDQGDCIHEPKLE